MKRPGASCPPSQASIRCAACAANRCSRPARRIAAGGAPLLAIGRFGKGRTLALMTDDAWRWNFIAVGNKETPQNHLKLMRQAVRWLAQEPSFEQVQLRPIPATQPGREGGDQIARAER